LEVENDKDARKSLILTEQTSPGSQQIAPREHQYLFRNSKRVDYSHLLKQSVDSAHASGFLPRDFLKAQSLSRDESCVFAYNKQSFDSLGSGSPRADKNARRQPHMSQTVVHGTAKRMTQQQIKVEEKFNE